MAKGVDNVGSGSGSKTASDSVAEANRRQGVGLITPASAASGGSKLGAATAKKPGDAGGSDKPSSR